MKIEIGRKPEELSEPEVRVRAVQATGTTFAIARMMSDAELESCGMAEINHRELCRVLAERELKIIPDDPHMADANIRASLEAARWLYSTLSERYGRRPLLRRIVEGIRRPHLNIVIPIPILRIPNKIKILGQQPRTLGS